MAQRPTPAELHYFSFHASDWLSSPTVRRMTRGERGDFIDLLCLAWGNGFKEPSLELRDLASKSERLKSQFRTRDGRLYNEKLSDVWHECQRRHTQAVNRGKRSGEARRKRKRLEQHREQQPQQAPLVLRESKDSLTKGAGALAPSEARPAQPSVVRELRRGEGLQRVPDADGILRMAGVKQ